MKALDGAGQTGRILITGGTGFVGTALIRLLRHSFPQCAVHIVGHGRGQPDIRDAESVSRVVQDFRPTAVVHLAAISLPAEAKSSPRTAWDVNLTGTMNLAEAVMRHAPDARFVFAGSSESYGTSFMLSNGPISETAHLRPRTVYAATKAAAELMLAQMANDGLDLVRFRSFNTTGPGQSDAYVVPAFARQVAEVKKGLRPNIIETGNLEAERDFVDVRDVARAYARVALGHRFNEASERIFNLASGKPIKIARILEKLIALSGIDINVRVDPGRLRPNEVQATCGDASAALAELGWAAEIPFDQTLADVFEDWMARLP